MTNRQVKHQKETYFLAMSRLQADLEMPRRELKAEVSFSVVGVEMLALDAI
jgi:hypothetical protein